MRPQQRLFYHVRVPYPALGDLIVPLVLLLHHEDVRRLWGAALDAGAAGAALAAAAPPGGGAPSGGAAGAAAALAAAPPPGGAPSPCPVPGVLQDVLNILRTHGAAILPSLGPDGGMVLSAASGAAHAAAQLPQATYHGELVSVRFHVSPGGDEGAYTVLSHAPGRGGVSLRPIPVAPFTLTATCAHKVAEVDRRRVALLGGGGASGGGPGGAAAAAAAAAAPAPG